MKRVFCVVLCFFVFLGLTPAYAADAPRQVELTLDSTSAWIDGENVSLDVAPVIENGTTLLPVRFVCEDILGAEVAWDPSQKKVTVTKEDESTELWLDKGNARVNGEDRALIQPPLLRDNRILVPLRFLSEAYGLNIDYRAPERKIVIRASTSPPPVADFVLVEPQVHLGQRVEVEDRSASLAEFPIVKHEWQVESPSAQKTAVDNLDEYFPVQTPGTYKIRLRVMDNQGSWSRWAERELIVLPNQPPVVVELSVNHPKTAQGEPLEFEADVQDPEGDNIQQMRWSYRWTDRTGRVREVLGKPEALFGEGMNYLVVLKAMDSHGNWSKEGTVLVEVTRQKKRTELEYKLSNPNPGEVIVNPEGENFNSLPDTAWTAEHDGPTLFISNSPEYVTSPGILYADKIEGDVRVFFHHKNTSNQNMRLVAWVENAGGDPVEIELGKAGLPGPSVDEMYLGQAVLTSFLGSGDAERRLTVSPVTTFVLNSPMDQKVIKPGQTISGMIEVSCSAPLVFRVAMVPENQSELAFLPVLEPDGSHIRGTFQDADVTIDVPRAGKKPEKVVVGKGVGDDPFIDGVDALTGQQVVDKGNYGVIYHFELHATTSTGILLNPRGLAFKGAFVGLDGAVYPAPQLGVMSFTQLAAVVGVAPSGKDVTFIYSAASGSDSPMVIALFPKDDWR